ncbi:hypothetical protein HYE60_01460 [Aggregatibacter actinomycetemcomitans]|uniref:hypothetical protein n=1 Tax=Aggregatibacter actinomycetemcomitans TaxID=714 RepID=UPI00197B38A8|nr:hypothetical protein [Aggregatibacter actinomycetemcomitans]MBN6073940.1 hypothetical protein [Aggregatibacter actinomycetemcomitans]
MEPVKRDRKTSIGTFTNRVAAQVVRITIPRRIPDGVYVWTEVKGTGHVFITCHKNDNVILYSYGRYDDAYIVTLGTMGEGVLIRYTGEKAQDYIKNELYRLDCNVYRIADASVDKVIAIFDKEWQSSIEKPDGKNVKSDIKNYGRVIDNYDLTGNNCTTKTSDVLKKSGSKLFNSKLWIIEYQEHFTIPSSLQEFLEEQSKTNKNVIKYTDIMKEKFPNDSNIKQIEKTGSSGATSGSSGDSSGSISNSSSMNDVSSGKSPASSGGSYGSSKN